MSKIAGECVGDFKYVSRMLILNSITVVLDIGRYPDLVAEQTGQHY